MTQDVLTPDAVAFLTELERRFGPRRRELLAARHERAQRLRDGELPDFLPETKDVRDGDWQTINSSLNERIDKNANLQQPATTAQWNTSVEQYSSCAKVTHPRQLGTTQILVREPRGGCVTFAHNE